MTKIGERFHKEKPKEQLFNADTWKGISQVQGRSCDAPLESTALVGSPTGNDAIGHQNSQAQGQSKHVRKESSTSFIIKSI